MTELPRLPDGTIDLPRAAAQVSLRMHQVHASLSGTGQTCRDIVELLPTRGELRDLFVLLVTGLAEIEKAFLAADMDLLDIATQIDWASLGIDPLPIHQKREGEAA